MEHSRFLAGLILAALLPQAALPSQGKASPAGWEPLGEEAVEGPLASPPQCQPSLIGQGCQGGQGGEAVPGVGSGPLALTYFR